MDSIWRQKLASALLTTFAFVALALTAIGLYGVISFEVSMNVRDIAVRMALGASRLNVLGSVGGSIVGSAQESDEPQAGVSLVAWTISVDSGVCATTN